MRAHTRASLLSQIKDRFPPVESLRFYAALFNNEFSYDATIRAHLQDLSRSIGCRGLREIQLKKLALAVRSLDISQVDEQDLRATIEDELPAPGRPSHFDVRLQLFEGLPFSTRHLEKVIPLPQAIEGTQVFRKIFTDRTILDITAAVGAIEAWYVPLAARLASYYLALGYTPHQVATYTLHKDADVAHSETALRFVATYSTAADHDLILDAVETGFRSVALYDEARFAAALDTSRSLEQWFNNA